MKAKVRVTNGRNNVVLVCEIEDISRGYEAPYYIIKTYMLSPSQIVKLKRTFGNDYMNDVSFNIINIINTTDYMFNGLRKMGMFFKFKNMTMKEIVKCVQNYYGCSKKNAEKVFNAYMTRDINNY